MIILWIHRLCIYSLWGPYGNIDFSILKKCDENHTNELKNLNFVRLKIIRIRIIIIKTSINVIHYEIHCILQIENKPSISLLISNWLKNEQMKYDEFVSNFILFLLIWILNINTMDKVVYLQCNMNWRYANFLYMLSNYMKITNTKILVRFWLFIVLYFVFSELRWVNFI